MAEFSMSELVKQQNRIYKSDSVAKRVINSNDIIMEKLAKLQSEQEAKNREMRLEQYSRETGEEFSKEIGPDDIDPGFLNIGEGENADNLDYGEIARNEANDILAAARAEAESIIASAKNA